MSIFQTSRLGSPSTIHSAITFPTPPDPAIPCAQNPAATKNPGIPDSPRMNSPSGVKASGPLSIFRKWLEPLPVLCQQPVVEVGRDSVETPRRRLALVPAHHQPAGVLAEVHEQVGVSQGGEVPAYALDRLGHQELVRHGHDRDLDASQGAYLVREHPAGVHNDVGPDRPERRLHSTNAAVSHVYAGDPDAG